MNEYTMIMNIATSLCKLNNWTMKRLDIHLNELDTFSFYSGYLYVNDTYYVIRKDGTFEERK